ncbi:MAG: hypothetical protein QOF57_2602 [Frankiaceae bacterium]|jgi:DNA-binding CsgD family transcriptional regulator|nr:hypothetical protein [Frankiaceae bacterium]
MTSGPVALGDASPQSAPSPVTDATAVALALSALCMTDCENDILSRTYLTPVLATPASGAGDSWTAKEMADAADALGERGLLDDVDESRPRRVADLAHAVAECVRTRRLEARQARSSERSDLYDAITTRLGRDTRLMADSGHPDDEFSALIRGARVVINTYADAPDDSGDVYYNENRNNVALSLSRDADRVGTEVDIVSPERLSVPTEAAYFSQLAAEKHCHVHTADVTVRLALIDDRMAVVPIDPHNHVTGALVTADTEAVAFVGLQMAIQLATAQTYAAEIPPTLLPRELTVLRLLAAGHTDEAAGRRIGMSDRSVRRLVAELQHKLGVDSRFELAVAAARHGLL